RATGPRAHGDGPARPRRGAVGDRARLPARGRLGGPSRREGPQSGAGMRLGGWQQRAGAGWVAHGPGPRFPLLPVLGRAEDKYHPWGDGITEPPVAWWQGSTRPSSEVMGSNPTGGGSTMFYFISLHFALGWTRHRARAGVAPRASCALGARRLGKSPIGSQLKPRTHARGAPRAPARSGRLGALGERLEGALGALGEHLSPPTGQAPALPARPLALPWPAPRRPPRPALARAPARLGERSCETPRALRRWLACPARPRRAKAQPSQRARWRCPARAGWGWPGPLLGARPGLRWPVVLRGRLGAPATLRARPLPSWLCPGRRSCAQRSPFRGPDSSKACG